MDIFLPRKNEKLQKSATLDSINAEIQRGIDDYHAGRFQDGETVFKELITKYELKIKKYESIYEAP